MPSALPDGEPMPEDGALPASALDGAASRPLGFYLHVPYCATRCGYCDFNTYTATELRGSGGVLASRDNYAETLADEVRLARKVLGDDPRPVRTVFVGGGTPTLLAAADLVRMLGAVRDEFGLADDAEVTTEANPESVDEAYLAELRAGGFNRVSFGMQSARQHVLKVLDRTHTPGRPEACVAEARAAGFDHVNLDLIYGTPGESDADWRATLDAALGAGPDHISAYALIVEEGTQLARRIRRGEVPMTDDDVHADRYLIADEVLGGAGLRVVRGLQLGHVVGGAVPAQRAVLAGGRLVGGRARCAQPRRGRAVVEREASRGLRGGSGGRAVARGRAGGPLRRGPPGRARPPGTPPPGRLPAVPPAGGGPRGCPQGPGGRAPRPRALRGGARGPDPAGAAARRRGGTGPGRARPAGRLRAPSALLPCRGCPAVGLTHPLGPSGRLGNLWRGPAAGGCGFGASCCGVNGWVGGRDLPRSGRLWGGAVDGPHRPEGDLRGP
ncbi:hypothetical protein SALBM135S_04742 [Streptomyces alboniger]